MPKPKQKKDPRIGKIDHHRIAIEVELREAKIQIQKVLDKALNLKNSYGIANAFDLTYNELDRMKIVLDRIKNLTANIRDTCGLAKIEEPEEIEEEE